MNSGAGAKAREDGQKGARVAERFDLEVKVDLESDHNFYTGLTQNISAGGLFIATHQLRRIGDYIKVSFSLPGSTHLGQREHRGALDPRKLAAPPLRRIDRHGRPLHRPHPRSLASDPELPREPRLPVLRRRRRVALARSARSGASTPSILLPHPIPSPSSAGERARVRGGSEKGEPPVRRRTPHPGPPRRTWERGQEEDLSAH